MKKLTAILVLAAGALIAWRLIRSTLNTPFGSDEGTGWDDPTGEDEL